MKEYNLHFYSSKPCNVFINGEQVGFIDNQEKFFIDLVVFSKSLIVSCEPISNMFETLIPFSFKLTHENNSLKSSVESAKVVPFPNSHFDVILNFKSATLNNKTTLFNKKIGSYNVLALIDNISTISIFQNDENLFTTKTEFLENVNASQINNILLFSGKQKNNNYLLAFNTSNNQPIFYDQFIKIEKDETTIKALKNLNNTLKHGKVFNLNLKTNKLNTYNVYLETFTQVNEENLIPLSFLEAIKEQDFNLAKTFLDSSLENTDEEKLKQYFNGVNEIYYNCYNLKQNVANYTIKNDETIKNFNFYLKNNRIADIEEIQIG